MMTGQNQHKTGPALATSRFMQEIMLPERFFQQEADQIARACRAMTRRLQRGGRLIAIGDGAWTADARPTLALVRPLSARRPGLPLLALAPHGLPPNGVPSRNNGNPITSQLQALARAPDVALAFTVDGQDSHLLSALAVAREMNLLTVGLCGGNGGAMASAGLDFCFIAPGDPATVQNIHSMLYHVLWEVLSTFLEHKRTPI